MFSYLFVSFVCFAVEEGVCVSQTHSLPAFDLSLLKFVVVDCSVGLELISRKKKSTVGARECVSSIHYDITYGMGCIA